MFRNKKNAKQDDRPARRRQDSASSETRPSASELSDRYAFRRNRTITGSSSARIASSTELNADLQGNRERESRNRLVLTPIISQRFAVGFFFTSLRLRLYLSFYIFW